MAFANPDSVKGDSAVNRHAIAAAKHMQKMTKAVFQFTSNDPQRAKEVSDAHRQVSNQVMAEWKKICNL